MRCGVLVLVLSFGCSRPVSDGEVASGAVVSEPEVKSMPVVTPQGVTTEVEAVDELPPDPPEDGPARERAAFAAALATIKPGMKEEEVRRIVGAPDDVRSERDAGGISAARTVEVWRWGTNGHLSFGTLGTVHVQADRTVQYVFGGAPPVATGIAEPELRRLLRLLDAVPSYNATCEPLRVIQAVNALQPLGKDRALAVIDEYLRVSSWLDDPGREGVFLVVRALFDPPAGEKLPVMMVGAPTPVPADMTAAPRFPLVLVEDIPLSIVRGYMLGGQAETPEMHLRWYRAHGVLRAGPLRPPDAPLAAIERAFAAGSPLLRTTNGEDAEGRAHAYDQALRLVDTVMRAPEDTYGRRIGGANSDAVWQARRAEFDALGATWDARRSLYVRAGGKLLPPAPRDVRPRTLWDLPLPGASRARMTVSWRGARGLDVEARLELAAGAVSTPAMLRLVDADSGARLADLALSRLVAPADSTTGSVMTSRVEVKPGVRVRAELLIDGKVAGSHEFTP